MRYSKVSRVALGELRSLFPDDEYVDDPDLLQPYGRDASTLFSLPEAVVKPRSVDQIVRLVKLAEKYHFPITPRGMGTGLAGGAVPVCGGVVVSFEKMNRVLELDEENFLIRVEPGIVNGDVKIEVEKRGLFYPPDPASFETCSIGGNVATNAGGPRCVKYGTTRDYVLSLEAVLPSGDLVKTGARTRKSVVGYDMTGLITGSEGTLAIITSATLRLIHLPFPADTILALAPDLESAMMSVSGILGSRILPSVIEFMDGRCLELVKEPLPFRFEENAVALLVEIDDPPELRHGLLERLANIFEKHGVNEIILATDSAKRSSLWEIRRMISLTIERSHELYIPEDVVVPLASIAAFVKELPFFEREYDLTIYTFGHAGDGNIHLNITASASLEKTRLEEGIRHILRRVVEFGGSISGEHGIGYVKKNYIDLEVSKRSLELQRGLKRLFDPKNILNPGKIFHQHDLE
ncbi:FAD-binding oxidoreductase [Thermodesulforhabdus norvegica]|uniref:D-lactate dehydrogenase (Cytochrome) n=1 Tax=Thermodesulforhabdus norvegica TaxID=39841 RepID=A0A1I4TSW8_9BACT|nr:FAD-linked oxidase C-terminal domain-containing protein [Thermodesulforhabdus norvegica]SFM79670.1 D-lactate dehydrogenase (cytochrome) [Thermodesulforhabdus norvegica]